MCGIAGVVGRRPEPRRIDAALEVMERRGPDSTGVHHGDVRGVPVTLLHRRLSIIDLDHRADQPFERDGTVLAFNGEIYNYVELRRELEQAGATFRTTGDTEVLAAAYQVWGDSFVEHLEGMWAFALHDQARGRLILSRDRFGEKPLFTMWHDGALWFGSQVSVLAALSGHKPTPDLAQVSRYLVNGYKALFKEPRTWYEDVRELPPATLAVVTDLDALAPQRYWDLRYQPQEMSLDDAVEGVRERFTDAVRLRLRADVPVALCLSGGIDSSALAAVAAGQLGQQVHAFSIIDDDPRYDELENITATVGALGIDHHAIHSSTEDFWARMEDLIAWRSAPIATLTYYLHSFLSEAISERGYKVSLSGTGADELFTGYYDHYAYWLAEMHGRPDFDRLVDDWRASYGAYVQNPLLQDPLAFVADPGARGHIYLDAAVFNDLLHQPFTEGFAESSYSSNTLRNRMLNELRHEIVPVILYEDDYNSMRWSVENRSPYLDRHLAEFAFSVPAEHLIHDGFAKYLLRASVEGVLPDSVRLDKRKRGFNAPVDSLIDRNDPATIDRLLAPGPLDELVRRDQVEEFVRGDLSSNSYSKFVFSYVSAKLFLEHHERWVP